MDSAALIAALEQFEGLYPNKIELSLERIEDVLETLGRPQDRLPPTIHVAGTNGKGSTCSYLRAMAEQAGLSVHVYTSPHLVHFNERFRIGAPGGGGFVGDETLADEIESAVPSAVSGRSFVVHARDFEDADRRLRQRTPDVCLLDVGRDAGVLRDFVERLRLVAPDLVVAGIQAPRSDAPTPSDVLVEAVRSKLFDVL